MFAENANPANVDSRYGFRCEVPTHPNSNVRTLSDALDRFDEWIGRNPTDIREVVEAAGIVDELTTDHGYITNGEYRGLSFFHDEFSTGLLKKCNVVVAQLASFKVFDGTFAELADILSFARVASIDPWQIRCGSGESAIYYYSPLNAINRRLNEGKSGALNTDIVGAGRWIANEPMLMHLLGFVASFQHRFKAIGDRAMIDPHFAVQIPVLVSGLEFTRDRVDTANKRDLSDYVTGWKLFGSDPANLVHPKGEYWGGTHGPKFLKKLDTTAKETVSKAISHYSGKQLDSSISDNVSEADKVLAAIGGGDFDAGKTRLAKWVKTVQDLDLSDPSKVKAPSGMFSSKLSFPLWAIVLWGLYKHGDCPTDSVEYNGQTVTLIEAMISEIREAVTNPAKGMKRQPVQEFVYRGSKGATGAKTPAKFAGLCNVLDTLEAYVTGQIDESQLADLNPEGRCFKSPGNPATKAGSVWKIPYDSPIIDSALRS